MSWPDLLGHGRFHYAGIGGSGMSALAQFQAMSQGRVSGSDRAFDRAERADARARLERLGIEIYPQDGSGVAGDCAALVLSTAVEEQVPDVAVARTRGIPIVHRSEMLAHWVRSFHTIAVAGTSGKSTVVAMIFEILRGAGRSPSVITGGDLKLLQEAGLWGNAWRGDSDLLVVEADESDGSLVRYEPAIGAVLNLQRDHREMDEVAGMFRTLRAQTRESFVVGEEPGLTALAGDAAVFGFEGRADVRGEEVELGPDGSRFEIGGTRFSLPVPGRHNVANALAAIACCRLAGVALGEMIEPLARFHGVGRRFQVVGSAAGVEVVDDFAHNPAKVAAVVETAHARLAARQPGAPSGDGRPEPREGRAGGPVPDAAARSSAGAPRGRVLAIYQPHGYGPTRFLRRDFVETFARVLEPEDRLWMLEVFYAGGTARRDFSAADIVDEIVAAGARAEFAPSREALVRRVAEEARAGDLVLVMGARDPSLTDLARAILERLETPASHTGTAAAGSER